MTNFIFCGAAGRMCRATMEIAKTSDKYNMVAGIDIVDTIGELIIENQNLQ